MVAEIEEATQKVESVAEKNVSINKTSEPTEETADSDVNIDGEGTAATAVTEEVVKHKSHRQRKRHYYNAIRQQIEFYFGDANLLKDRFLKKLITQDPFVPLQTFLSFNKIKALTNSTEEIAKALSTSELLEFDESQQKVRRKIALPEDRNVDNNTLYVEALPPTADHDWVRNMFSRFGAISYVSLPKYAKSRKIKEFGFIEFENENSVHKAVKAFKEFNGVLSMEETKPAELKSIKAFNKEKNNARKESLKMAKKKDKKQDSKENSNEEIKKEVKLNTEVDLKPIAAQKSEIVKVEDIKVGTKRTKDDEEDVDKKEEPQSKRVKIENEETTQSETATSSTDSSDEQASDGDENTGKAAESNTKKKARKKKKKVLEKRKKDISLNVDAAYYDLKILPKRDWKRLRNQYLNTQRETIALLKRNAWNEKQKQQQFQEKQNDDNKKSEEDSVADKTAAADTTEKETVELAKTTPPKKKSKPNDRKLRKINMNFYGAGEDEQCSPPAKVMKREPTVDRTPLFTYEPGIIVEVSFLEPCVNIKEFKADMRQYTVVKYVDVKEGAMQAQLRLESPTATTEFVAQINCAEYQCKILSGESEKEYWKKIEKDREMKFNKTVKVPQKRGREKKKKLVSQHIRFEDEDE